MSVIVRRGDLGKKHTLSFALVALHGCHLFLQLGYPRFGRPREPLPYECGLRRRILLNMLQKRVSKVLASFKINQPRTRGLDPSSSLHGPKHVSVAAPARWVHRAGARGLKGN